MSIHGDLALQALKNTCESGTSRINSKFGPLVTVVEVFRNSDAGNHIFAKCRHEDGAEIIVPATKLFVAYRKK